MRGEGPSDADSTQASQARLVAIALPVAVVAISFAAIFFRKAAPTHPLTAAGTRLAVAAILLLPWTVRAVTRAQPPRFWRYGLLAGLLYGVHFGTWVASLSLTTIAASVTLVTATPLLLGLHAHFTGKDRPGRRLWFTILLAFVGVSIIGGHDLALSVDMLWGDLLAAVGAVAIAGYLLLVRRLGPKLDVWAFSGVATAVGAIALLGTALLVGVDLRPTSLDAFGYLVLAALVPQLIGHNLMTWSLRYTRPTVVGMSTVGEPVGATILGYFWLHEVVPPLVAVGCGVTLAAVLLALKNTSDAAPSASG